VLSGGPYTIASHVFAAPGGVAAAVAETGDVSYDDLVGSERVAVGAVFGWAHHPLAIRAAYQVPDSSHGDKREAAGVSEGLFSAPALPRPYESGRITELLLGRGLLRQLLSRYRPGVHLIERLAELVDIGLITPHRPQTVLQTQAVHDDEHVGL
jgi:hypothetical protein